MNMDVGRLRQRQRRGIITMRTWFDGFEVFIRWSTPSLGNIYNDDLIKYLNRMYLHGWVEEDKNALNEIRELYLINKDNSSVQYILK